uniref:Uncharacterized protein n=1 Tax=Nomascus leucogenys TaxID=61853 RepID=A0A2I3H538_NOMLE
MGARGHICVWTGLCVLLRGGPDFHTSGESTSLTLKASSLFLAVFFILFLAFFTRYRSGKAFERTEAYSLCASTRGCAVLSPDVHVYLVCVASDIKREDLRSVCRDYGASEVGMVLPGLLICSPTQCALQL